MDAHRGVVGCCRSRVRDGNGEQDESEGHCGSSNRIVIISDGLETCDGDPVASAQGLLDQGIEVVVDVIGFDLADADRASLEEVARVTGGTYRDARTGAGP